MESIWRGPSALSPSWCSGNPAEGVVALGDAQGNVEGQNFGRLLSERISCWHPLSAGIKAWCACEDS